MNSNTNNNTKLEEQQNHPCSDSDASLSDSAEYRDETTITTATITTCVVHKNTNNKNLGQRISSSRKRIIDETLLSPEEADKLQTKRAYNRDCATRARLRTKNRVSQLQGEIKQLQTDKNDIRQENATMKVQLKNLERMNQTLMLKQSMSEQQLQQGMRSLTTAGTGDWPRTSNHLDSMFSLSELLAARRQNAAASSHANFLLYGGQS